MPRRPYDGNRIAVPEDFVSPHFCYKTAGPHLNPEDINTVVQAAKLDERRPVGPYIDFITCSSQPEPVRAALSRLKESLHEFIQGESEEDIVLLGSECAVPHVDVACAGAALLSVVLHTGPYPYTLYTFHSARDPEAGSALTRVDYPLAAGETFIFDPTTPHCTAPDRMDSGQLLLLLQAKLADDTVKDRRRILQRFAPLDCEFDVDYSAYS